MLILTVIQGPDKGKVFRLPDHEPQLVGRSSEALPISDTTVSRRHAELTPDDGEWWIRDLGSQNGTWVNGIRIEERLRLKLGDQIRTGASLFVFGRTDAREHDDVIRMIRPEHLGATVERSLPSNDDSVILAEPEPRSAAVHHLRIIYQLTTLTSQLMDRDRLLHAVMDLVFEEFKPERGFIILSDAIEAAQARDSTKSPTPRPAVVKYASPPATKDEGKFHVSRTILQHVITRSEGVLSSNAMSDKRFAAGDSVQHLAIRSAICSPIRFREETYGAIYIDSSMANFTFTPEQLALMNAIGQHTGLAIANLDLYAENMQAERLAAIGETVASLSHSIKNILQGLRGGADVVEMGLKKEDMKVARGGWSILKRNLDRIMGLTLNMLAYSRQRTLEPELTRLAPLVEDVAQLLHDPCQAKGVALLVDVDAEMPPVALDPNLMHQALMNLVSNAVEAVESRKGIVTIKAVYRPADPARRALSPQSPSSRPEVHIAIIDNGPGIPPEVHEKIFLPFYSTKGLRGTGLGLAVTRRIIEQHGGRIWVESDEGKGATFHVVIPGETILSIDPSATAESKERPGRGVRL